MILGVKLLCLLAAVQAVLLGATDHRATAADVVEIVFTSLSSDHDDARLAHELKKLQITEQLNPHVVSYFQNDGIGPAALSELLHLRDKSALLPPPRNAPFSIQPLPEESDRKEILQRVRGYVQSYVHSLPNFLCDEVTRRYTNMIEFAEGGNPRFVESVHPSDHFTQSLRFVNGVEDLDVPGHSSRNQLRKIEARTGHSLSRGEFGTDMAFVFGSGVNPELQWHHWEMFRQKRTAVFSYFVGLPDSQFTLIACCNFSARPDKMQQRVRAPVRGLAYIDPDTGVISRLTIQPTSLPSAFWIKESETVIDYAAVKIGNHSYTLPVKALVFIRSEIQNGSNTQKNLNEISFLNYRKFETESVFTYAHSTISYGSGTDKQ